MQVYAYQDVYAAPEIKVETGTVCPITTEHGMSMLADMVEAGIRPPVMVLKWSLAGNHFQAENYPEEAHTAYAQNIGELSIRRNEILVEHGWKALDSIEYDAAKTSRAAAAVLAAVRRAAKASKAREQMREDTEGDANFDEGEQETEEGKAVRFKVMKEAETGPIVFTSTRQKADSPSNDPYEAESKEAQRAAARANTQ
ncbi:hypothetical protein PR001_g30919 [Phytophthora rubi]|uniref:Uncharacterized protein n=1 Tax=Phytophthora rubi TaxID=129364 RepID=A0A6A3GN13_9STRA|nr:hypothetical protein PR001_g30919 [Phytophthora rubi]